MREIDMCVRIQTVGTPSEKRRQIGCTVFPLGSRVRGNDGACFANVPRTGKKTRFSSRDGVLQMSRGGEQAPVLRAGLETLKEPAEGEWTRP